MATNTPLSTTAALQLITAALAFLDSPRPSGRMTTGLSGPKARLRTAVEGLVVSDERGGGPPLRVIHGGALDR